MNTVTVICWNTDFVRATKDTDNMWILEISNWAGDWTVVNRLHVDAIEKILDRPNPLPRD